MCIRDSIIAAKNDFAHLALSAQLADRSLSRVYEEMCIRDSLYPPRRRDGNRRGLRHWAQCSLYECHRRPWAVSYTHLCDAHGKACNIVNQHGKTCNPSGKEMVLDEENVDGKGHDETAQGKMERCV